MYVIESLDNRNLTGIEFLLKFAALIQLQIAQQFNLHYSKLFILFEFIWLNNSISCNDKTYKAQ